jgi:hypothetical protein
LEEGSDQATVGASVAQRRRPQHKPKDKGKAVQENDGGAQRLKETRPRRKNWHMKGVGGGDDEVETGLGGVEKEEEVFAVVEKRLVERRPEWRMEMKCDWTG